MDPVLSPLEAIARSIQENSVAHGETPVRPLYERAFCTLITSDSFLPGVEVLVHTLRKHTYAAKGLTEEEVPILVIHPPGLSKHVLRKIGPAIDCAQVSTSGSAAAPAANEWLPTRTGLGCLRIEVAAIPNPYAGSGHGVHVQGWVDCGFTKLHLWGPALAAAARTVVYLDCDMLVCGDISPLFDRPGSPLSAAPDLMPPDRFNAGLLVVSPHPPLFHVLAHLAATRALPSYDGGDTGLLNAAFPSWFTSDGYARSGPGEDDDEAAQGVESAVWGRSNRHNAAVPVRIWRREGGHRLPFAYNSQRILHWFTASKAPGYWSAVCGCPAALDALLLPHAEHTASQEAPCQWGAYTSDSVCRCTQQADGRPGQREGALPTAAGGAPPTTKVLHYSSSPKPWQFTGDGVGGVGQQKRGPLELLWWAQYMEAKQSMHGASVVS